MPYLRRGSLDYFQIDLILCFRVQNHVNKSQICWDLNTGTFYLQAPCAAHPLLVQVRLRRLRIGTRLGAELERSKTKQANSGLKLCPRFLELKRYTLLQAIVLCGSCLPLPVADMLKGSTVPSPFPCFFTYFFTSYSDSRFNIKVPH